MDEKLISKKRPTKENGNYLRSVIPMEKKKKLIPEEWFIRKATFTGQETFFLKKKNH